MALRQSLTDSSSNAKLSSQKKESAAKTAFKSDPNWETAANLGIKKKGLSLEVY
jgi:hypothetical protein